MKKKENKTAPLGVRVRPSVKAALEKLARAEKRTLANMVEFALDEFVERRTAEKA